MADARRTHESRMWFQNGAVFKYLEQPLTQFPRSRYSLTLNISQAVKDTTIVTMEGE